MLARTADEARSGCRFFCILGVVAPCRPAKIQVKDAIGPPVASIDHAGLVGLDVVEEVEVVTDELHLTQSIGEGHRRRRVDLLPHLNGTVVEAVTTIRC